MTDKCPKCDSNVRTIDVFGKEFTVCTNEQCDFKEATPDINLKKDGSSVLLRE